KVEVDEGLALAGLEKGYSLATDVAEYLVMKGVPFREAHAQVGRLVGYCVSVGLSFGDLTIEQWQKYIPEADSDMMKILSPRQSVKRRNTYGGTGFDEVRRQIDEAKIKLFA
ncbi:MAG: argininosuccinate lyase, partial [Synergistaceae bacterium]|nr:argininosuccinate lyase [Synergistaceae bacterium]